MMVRNAFSSILRRPLFRTMALGVLAAASALPVAATVIDEFTTNQGPVADPAGAATSVTTGGADIVGQHRGLDPLLLSGAGPVQAQVGGGVLAVTVTDTTPDSRGAAIVTWDGDTDPNVLDADGLSSLPLDLTASGHTAFAVTVDAADAGAEIVLEVYTDAANMSRAALRLPPVVSSTVFHLSYKNDFVPRLGSGADFADVGAIVMTVRGTETAVSIDRVETVAPSLAAPKVDLTLADVPIGATPQTPGTTFKYRVTITNTGGEALRVDLADAIDPNTTLDAATVDATVVAGNDVYETHGNVGFTVTAAGNLYDCDPATGVGLLANDCDPDTVDAAPPDPTELVITTVGTFGTALGGSATISADGSFTYTPPYGVGDAVDTFGYTVADDDGNSASATVRVHIGRRIWFVDDDADATGGVDGTGTRTDPFDQLTPLAGGADPDQPGDLIFVHSGTYLSGIALEDRQELIGQAQGLVLDHETIAVGTAPTIQNAGGHGVVVAKDNAIRGITVGDTSGVGVTGSNFGALTVENVTVTGTGAALDLANGTLAAAFNSISSTDSGGRGVNLDTVTGALVSGSTSVTDSAQAGIRVTNGGSTYTFGSTTLTSTVSGLELTNNATSTFSFTSLAVTTDAGPGILASSSGTLSIGGAGNSIAATGGAALDVTSTSFGAGATFTTVSSSGSPGKGFNFDGVAGAFTASGGSISGATGIAFDVNAGTGSISYAGGITNAANRAVEITGRTTSTLTLSGNVSDSGTGVNVSGNSGGTITLSGTYNGTAASSQIDVTGNSGIAVVNFSGSSKVLSTGASNAIDVTSNGTATVSFTGGGLIVTTTSGIGFNVTGGAGGVNVDGAGNSIASTTGTALNVVGTNIGPLGVKFQSISSNGSASGIVLNGTGAMGGLTVTGTGSSGSGGTIQNTTSDAVLLTNTQAVDLSWMNIQNANEDGIFGTTVTGLDLTSCNITNNGDDSEDTGIRVNNLLGTSTWSDLTVTQSELANVLIDNTTGTLDSLSILGGNYSNLGVAFGGNSILIGTRGDAVLTSGLIDGATIANNGNARGLTVQAQFTGASNSRIGDLPPGTTHTFTVQNCTFTNNGLHASFEQSGAANLAFKFLDNLNMTGAAPSHAFNVASSATATGGTIRGRIQGNTIGNAGVAGSGSTTGNGIRAFIQGKTVATLLIDGNTIRQTPLARGLSAEFIGPTAAGQPITQSDITVTNNNVNPQDSTGFPLAAIYVAADDQGSPARVRADIRGNTVPGTGTVFDVLDAYLILYDTTVSSECQLVDTPPASATATAQLTSTNTGDSEASATCTLISGPINTPP